MGPMTAQADGNNGPSKKGGEAVPVLGGARAEFCISRPTARSCVSAKMCKAALSNANALESSEMLGNATERMDRNELEMRY